MRNSLDDCRIAAKKLPELGKGGIDWADIICTVLRKKFKKCRILRVVCICHKHWHLRAGESEH